MESDDHGIGRMSEYDVAFRDATDRGMQHPNLYFCMLELCEFLADRFDRTAHVGTNDEPQFPDLRFGHATHQCLERDVPVLSQRLGTLPTAALLGDLPCLVQVVDHHERVACCGHHVVTT